MRRLLLAEGDPARACLIEARLARPEPDDCLIEARLARPEPDDCRGETVNRLDRAQAQEAELRG